MRKSVQGNVGAPAGIHPFRLILPKLVAIGFVIAVPMAGWIMHQWLQNFCLPHQPELVVFALSGLAMVWRLSPSVVQTIRAATANPVKALRSE